MDLKLKLKVATDRASKLAEYLDQMMSEMERSSDSTTSLPEAFDDILFAHDKVNEALYALQNRLK